MVAATPRELGARLDALHADPFLARATLASKIIRLDSGEPLYDAQAHKLLVPASTVKLVTTVALLAHLPADQRVQTRIGYRGALDEGTLDGDLVLIGTGDPSFSSDDVATLADQIVAMGLREIRGELIGDARLFSAPALGRGWMWDDLHTRFSPPISALSIDGNTAELLLHPGEVGQPATAAPHPCLPVRLEVLTTASGTPPELEIYRLPHQTETLVRGTLPEGKPHRQILAIPEPASCAAGHLREALIARGVSIHGPARPAYPHDPAEVIPLAHHPSPPLRDLLRPMMVQSENHHAEVLLRWLDPAPEGRDFRGAYPAVQATLRAAGVPEDAYRLADGSGLSRYNQLTAEALVRLLRYSWHQPWREELLATLPRAGQGTLRARLLGGPAESQVQAKSGSMTGVFNLTGYLIPEDGEPLAFALLANGVDPPGAAARYSQDALLHLLAASPDLSASPSRGCRRAQPPGLHTRSPIRR